jgi:hypothetical protein
MADPAENGSDQCDSRPGFIERAQDDVVKMLNARFTGLIVVAIIGTWLASALMQQLGYGTTADSLGRIAELAFVSYVIKKAYQTNGNGAKP